jgi:ribosomal protein L17
MKGLFKGNWSRMGRGTAHRLAMLKNMATSLIIHERIKTTVPKARNLKSVAEKMVTFAKTGNLHRYVHFWAMVCVVLAFSLLLIAIDDSHAR